MNKTKYVDEKALAHFDRFYRNLEKEIISAPKGIDIVLIHHKVEDGPKSNKENEEERKNEVRVKLRKKFKNKLRIEGFDVEETVLNDKVYTKLHCSFRRLCIEAEMTHLQMPLLGLTYPDEDQTNMCFNFIYKKCETDKTVHPKSTRFKMKRIHLFENHLNPSRFFRPAIRTLLVNNILIHMNLINDVKKDDTKLLDKDVDGNCLTRTFFNIGANSTLATDRKFENLSMLNFPNLKKLGVYTDILILHEPSEYSKFYDDQPEHKNKGKQDVQDNERPSPIKDVEGDPRKVLNDEWNTFDKFQPLTKIRNYFGEKIAFYFTWSGLLMTQLWVPMILGLAIFIFGLLYSVINETDNSSAINATDNSSAVNTTDNSRVTPTLVVFYKACDNVITPFYAFIICVWGTIFLNVWKRKTALLAYKWAVDGFEVTETNRPEFYGTKRKEHPVTGNDHWYYPMKKRLTKVLLSGLILFFILCIVLASVIGILIGKAFVRLKYCSNDTDQCCVLVTKLGSFLLNLISILIFDKIYVLVARRLTDWENHRTQTSYDDALILFAAALPIAPLIVLFTNFIDKWLDARRMLWWYRRPLATIAQDTGMWYIILKFVNICGVISNGFLIGFTSSRFRHCDVYERLWIVVGFEHIVLAFKLLFDYLIPDVSPDVRLMSTKDMHDISITIKKDKEQSDCINGITNPQAQDSELQTIPKANQMKQTQVKKLLHRSLSKQKKRHRVDREKTDEEVYNNRTRHLRKRNKKKKLHQRQEDKVDDKYVSK